MSVFAKDKQKNELVGNTEPICPYCSSSLDKMPGRKKQCPNCGNFMYVRTRPIDGKKVVITKHAIGQVENLWTMLYDVRQVHIADEKVFEKEKAILSTRFRGKPSDHDVFWSICNKQLLEYSKQSDWGLFRNTRLNMAQLLTLERKYRVALDTFLEVSYIDANGPNNMGGIQDAQLVKKYPPFNRKHAFQAVAIVSYIKTLSDWLDFTQRDLKESYLKVASQLSKDMGLTVSPKDGWNDLEVEMIKIIK
jgi:hypothetical protein